MRVATIVPDPGSLRLVADEERITIVVTACGHRFADHPGIW